MTMTMCMKRKMHDADVDSLLEDSVHHLIKKCNLCDICVINMFHLKKPSVFSTLAAIRHLDDC